MAIGPQDLQVLTPEDEANVAKIEKIIDSKLQANYDIGGSMRLNISTIVDGLKCRLTFKMRKELFTRYQKVGWNVEPESVPSQAGPTTEFFTFNEPVQDLKPQQKDIMIPDIETQEKLNKMSEEGTAPKPSGPVSPFKPKSITTRESYDNPYKRTKLNSMP